METYGRYQLLKRLATGGMAEIYLARQTGPERFEKLLVLKRILPHLAENEEFVRMFLDEARIAARLNHGNVVQIFDLGAQDDSYFIAMEYIHGEDARRVWKRADAVGKPLPVPLVCRIIIDACAGLDYAHKRTDQSGKPLGIVHRDISPQNILVTFEGGVKVVDFGIAKAADQATVTRSGVLKGKYSYMSPEQASGKRLDARSDIFALGVVLYELLTGTRLFKRHSDLQTLSAVMACEVMLPSRVNAKVPADLDPIVMKALAKEPEDRYQEALQLQLALEGWLVSHQLASSSAHLSAFMGEIYAERLKKEAALGEVLFDEEPGREDESRGKRSARSSKMTPLSRPDEPSKPPTAVEMARTDRIAEGDAPTRPSERAAPRPSHDALDAPSLTISAQGGPPAKGRAPPPKRAFGITAGIAAAAAAVAVGAAAWFGLHLQRPLAVIHVMTDPPGATVVFDGRAVPNLTPCTLPPVSAGLHGLTVGKRGYEDFRATVNVPETGEVTLPLMKLEPQGSALTAQTEPKPAEPVHLTLRTDPDGAAIAIDGAPRGKTPLTLDVDAGTVLGVRVERAGFRELERKVQVGGERAQVETFALEKLEKPKPPTRPVAAKGEPEKRPLGQVRFAVTPWAEVSCGGQRLGQTPFQDRELPAGTYDCTFTNPQFGTKTERVEVKPNELAKVTVKF